ncbi:RNA-dependent RNA polymerase [Marchantia polymorpha subsp. ruderalis]
MEPTQASIGNFPADVTSKELAEFLEMKVGYVLKCRVKNVAGTEVPPHAFVHFESAAVANEACKRASRKRLVFRGLPLIAQMEDRLGRRGFNPLKNPANIHLVNVKLGMGSLVKPRLMLVSWEGPPQGLTLRIEPDVKRMRFFFSANLELNRGKSQACDVMLNLELGRVKVVREIKSEAAASDCDLELLIQLWSPPSIFYRTAEDDVYEYCHGSAQLTDDEDPWTRSVDVITPAKSVGRCLDYRIRVRARQCTAVKKALAYFQSLGLLEKPCSLSVSDAEREGPKPNHYFLSVPIQKGFSIPFSLMFLVNGLVHQNVVHETALSPEFFRLLQPAVTPEHVTTHALRLMLTSSQGKVFDPTRQLKAIINRAPSVLLRSMAGSNVLVRRLIITPTRVLCLPPEIECSNRVLRQFSAISDRFMRVTFVDENFDSITPSDFSVQTAPIVRTLTKTQGRRSALFYRVKSFMAHGFSLCGRQYMFLAFSASQLRDNSAWFFAGTPRLGVDHIRGWMGSFPRGNVAKFAARMGLCFSATFSTEIVPREQTVTIDDVMANGYTFSDGCGKISPSFAPEVARLLNLEEHPPCAYQIRYGGHKGVLGVWPIEEGPKYKLALRGSMRKFDSQHCQLEIVAWAKFIPSYLNRQIITLLSTLNVQDSVFINLQDTMVDDLNRMINDRELAYSVLMNTCPGELYSTPLRMLCAGFRPQDEMHLRSMLVATRAAQIDRLVQKTNIFVSDGRLLMGVMDETGTLEYGQCFIRASSPPRLDIRGIYRQSSSVVTGRIIMTKNPCLHPGDIRVLQAVDVPALHHMVDCLVFPQKGPRPHSNEASGSDLDGDVYFVTWDQRLIPPSGVSSEPMNHKCSPQTIVQSIPQDVRIQEVIDFFVKYMLNDKLGRISNAQVVHADRSDLGALDEKCLILAELAVTAVDYPKTGKPAEMPPELAPKEYPDFLGKPAAESYKSQKVLGILYRKVVNILPKLDAVDPLLLRASTDQSQAIPDPNYDTDLEISGFEAYLDEAWSCKQHYDQKLRVIMSQFGISDEGQVATGRVVLGRRQGVRANDVRDKLKLEYLALQKEFRTVFQNDPSLSHKDQDQDQTPGELALIQRRLLEAKASAWYHVTYHPKWYHKAKQLLIETLDDTQLTKRSNLLSFPWVAVEQLVAIKSRRIKSRRARE